MADSKPNTTPTTNLYRIRRKLPAAYSMEIGRIITRYAYVQHLLRSISYRLLRIGPEQGRIAVQEKRAVDQLAMIQDLVDLASITVKADWKYLKTILRECESFRHRLAHGIWLYHTGSKTPVLQDISTAYLSPPILSKKPKISPIATVIPLKQLRDITKNIDKVIDYLIRLDRKIIELMQPPSP